MTKWLIVVCYSFDSSGIIASGKCISSIQFLVLVLWFFGGELSSELVIISVVQSLYICSLQMEWIIRSESEDFRLRLRFNKASAVKSVIGSRWQDYFPMEIEIQVRVQFMRQRTRVLTKLYLRISL